MKLKISPLKTTQTLPSVFDIGCMPFSRAAIFSRTLPTMAPPRSSTACASTPRYLMLPTIAQTSSFVTPVALTTPAIPHMAIPSSLSSVRAVLRLRGVRAQRLGRGVFVNQPQNGCRDYRPASAFKPGRWRRAAATAVVESRIFRAGRDLARRRATPGHRTVAGGAIAGQHRFFLRRGQRAIGRGTRMPIAAPGAVGPAFSMVAGGAAGSYNSIGGGLVTLRK